MKRRVEVRFHPIIVTSLCRPANHGECSMLEDFVYHFVTCKLCDEQSLLLCAAGVACTQLLKLHFVCIEGRLYVNQFAITITMIELPRYLAPTVIKFQHLVSFPTPTKYIYIMVAWEARSGRPSLLSEWVAIDVGAEDLNSSDDCGAYLPNQSDLSGPRTVAAWGFDLADLLTAIPAPSVKHSMTSEPLLPLPSGQHALSESLGKLSNCFYDARGIAHPAMARPFYGSLSCTNFCYECDLDERLPLNCPQKVTARFLFHRVKCGYI